MDHDILKDRDLRIIAVTSIRWFLIALAIILLILVGIWFVVEPRDLNRRGELWSMMEGISSLGALAAIAAGTIAALWQQREVLHSRNLEAYTVVFQYLMSDEHIAARGTLYRLESFPVEQGSKGPTLSDETFRAIDAYLATLDNTQTRQMKMVLNEMDYLGVIIGRGWVGEDALLEWASPMVSKSWVKLEPFVLFERMRRNEPYYYLAAGLLGERSRREIEGKHGQQVFLKTDKTI